MENFLTSSRFRILSVVLIVGIIFVAGGIFFFKSGLNFGGTKVEILSAGTETGDTKILTVEISGEVITPGVYKLPAESRIDDLLIVAGGFTANADRIWTDKYLNRASKVTDGQKVYIPSVDQQLTGLTANKEGGDQTISTKNSSDSNTPININTASLQELDSLPGIGPVYGQSIIEHRPYSTIQELVSKGAINQNLFEKVKNGVSIY